MTSKDKAQYTRENFERICLVIPKGTKATLHDLQAQYGESISGLFRIAFEEKFGIKISNSKRYNPISGGDKNEP
jgi:hypothetical protein